MLLLPPLLIPATSPNLILTHLDLMDTDTDPLQTQTHKFDMPPKVTPSSSITTFELVIKLPRAVTFSTLANKDGAIFERLCIVQNKELQPPPFFSVLLAEVAKTRLFTVEALHPDALNVLALDRSQLTTVAQVRDISVGSSSVLCAEKLILERNLQALNKPFVVTKTVTYMKRAKNYLTSNPYGNTLTTEKPVNIPETIFNIIVPIGDRGATAVIREWQHDLHFTPGILQHPVDVESLHFSLARDTTFVPFKPSPRNVTAQATNYCFKFPFDITSFLPAIAAAVAADTTALAAIAHVIPIVKVRGRQDILAESEVMVVWKVSTEDPEAHHFSDCLLYTSPSPRD